MYWNKSRGQLQAANSTVSPCTKRALEVQSLVQHVLLMRAHVIGVCLNHFLPVSQVWITLTQHIVSVNLSIISLITYEPFCKGLTSSSLVLCCDSVFEIKSTLFWDAVIPCAFLYTISINSYWGVLTDFSAKTETPVPCPSGIWCEKPSIMYDFQAEWFER